MTRTLVENIGLLVTNESSFDGTPLGILRDAAFLIEKGSLTWVGESKSAPRGEVQNKIDAHKRCIIPGFVDSHTHLIFAGDRSEEFGARMRGERYSAGGIATTVEMTRRANNGQLLQSGRRLLAEANASGTTTIECKSGYGLSVEDEARQLVVARQLTEETTFLGAHIVPKEYSMRPDDYVDLVCGPMLEAAKPNAKWIDVFCDKGAFTPDQSRKILKAGMAKGLLPRIHANQFEPGEGAQTLLICRIQISISCPGLRLWQLFSRRQSFQRDPNTRMLVGYSRQVSRWHWHLTAIREVLIQRICLL
jgi:imidazolonepropionase